MSDTARSSLDEDRLPWLEAVDEDDQDRVSRVKLIAFAVAAAIALAIVIGGVWLLQRADPESVVADPKLIAAPSGDYKQRPAQPGGMAVEGRGDSSFATSEGAEVNAAIDLAALPETPVTEGREAVARPAAPVPAPAKSVAAVALPEAGGRLVAAPPSPALAPSRFAEGGGTIVQLGAFDSEAQAKAAWTRLSQRFEYLAPLANGVMAAEVRGSRVYRLRADAGGESRTVCGKLRIAGENCMVVN